MLKSMVVAGLFAVGIALPGAAANAGDRTIGVGLQGQAETVWRDCFGEAGTWLPGTLQIDEPVERTRTAQDCALV